MELPTFILADKPSAASFKDLIEAIGKRVTVGLRPQAIGALRLALHEGRVGLVAEQVGRWPSRN